MNDDGLKDLVCAFDKHAAFPVGGASGVLRGKTVNGITFKGTDFVYIDEYHS